LNTGPNQPPGLVAKSSKSDAFETRLRRSVFGEREKPTFRARIATIFSSVLRPRG
jgi:hypothetical protein